MFRSLPSAAFSSSTACPGSPPAPARRHSLADLGPSGIQLLSSHIASEVAGSGGYHSCGPASPPLHASLPHHRFHPLKRGDIPLRPARSARCAAFPFQKRQSLLPTPSSLRRQRPQIGRAPVSTPATNAHLVCRH